MRYVAPKLVMFMMASLLISSPALAQESGDVTAAREAEKIAQEKTDQPQVDKTANVDDQHREIAGQFFALMDVKETFMAGFMVGVEPHLEQMKQSGMPADKQLKIRQAFIRFGQTVANDPELTRRLVDVYAQLFSKEELARLVEFYNTPAGRKFLKMLPTLTQQSAVVGEQIGIKHQAQLKQEIEAILRESDEDASAPAGSSPAPSRTP